MHTIETQGIRPDILAKRTQEMIASGHEVVLVIQETAPPERVLKIIHACVGDDKIDLVIRHAELKEYLQNALTGGVIGAGFGAWSVVLAKLAGATISLPVTLTAIGIGALLGATIGAGVTPIAEARVYRYRGETRVKLIPA